MGTYLDEHPLQAVIVILALAAVVAGVGYVFARLLLRNLTVAATADSPMTTLMLILGTLSVVALLGALVTRDESAFTIAATGMGAFAGALTARAQYVADARRTDDDGKDDDEPQPQ